MSIKEIKKQIHLLTTVKLLLQIDGRINEWNLESKLIVPALLLMVVPPLADCFHSLYLNVLEVPPAVKFKKLVNVPNSKPVDCNLPLALILPEAVI